MDRCWLKGELGDALHAVLCATGYNLRWLLRAMLRLGLKATFLRPVLLLLISLLSSDHARSNSLTQNFRMDGALRRILQGRLSKLIENDAGIGQVFETSDELWARHIAQTIFTPNIFIMNNQCVFTVKTGNAFEH